MATRGALLPLTRVPALNTFSEPAIPPEMDVQLSYPFIKTLSAAAAAVAARLYTNAAYDVDPTLGSTSTPGFAEWAALYNFYRVVAYSYDITFVNNEAFPIIAWTLSSNTDPGLGATSVSSSNPLGASLVLSAKTGLDKGMIARTHRVSHVIGSDAVEYEDNYRALVSGVPADLAWLGFGIQSISGANVTNGASIFGHLRMFVRFYDRKILAS